MQQFTCPTRQELEATYRERLEWYVETMAKLAKTEGFQDAELRCANLYDDCKAARDALYRHEDQHGCKRGAASDSAAA